MLTDSVQVKVEQAIAMGRSVQWMTRHYGVTRFDVAWVRAYLDEINVETQEPRQRTHGTYGGYRQHNRNKTPPCADCRAAYAQYRATERKTA